MAASGAKSGYGTTLELSDGEASPAYTAIAEVFSITGPSMSRTMIDVTHFTSDDKAHEYIGGLIAGGEVRMTMNFFADATHNDLIDSIQNTTDTGGLLDSDIVRTYRLKFANPAIATFVFNAAVQSIDPRYPTDDRITAEVVFRVCGLPSHS